MTSTRADIRKAAIDQDVWRACAYGTITASDRESITDTTGNLGYGGESANKFNNRRIYLPAEDAADMSRLIVQFEPQRRRLIHGGPNYGAAPDVPSSYEIHAFDPSLINRSLNRALQRRCFSVQRDDITADGSTLYTIGTAPFDVLASISESPEQQILDIEQLQGTAPNDVARPWDTGGRVWWAELDNNVLAVRFDPAPTGTFRVIWKKPYDALTTEAATTTCPVAYAMWGMLYELYASLEERAIHQHESADEFRRLKLDFEVRLAHERRVALGRYAGRLRRTHQTRTRRRAPVHGLT